MESPSGGVHFISFRERERQRNFHKLEETRGLWMNDEFPWLVDSFVVASWGLERDFQEKLSEFSLKSFGKQNPIQVVDQLIQFPFLGPLQLDGRGDEERRGRSVIMVPITRKHATTINCLEYSNLLLCRMRVK